MNYIKGIVLLTLVFFFVGLIVVVTYYHSTNESPNKTPSPTTNEPPLDLQIISPENKTYKTSDITLNYSLSRAVDEITYSLDGEKKVLTGNQTLSKLTNGIHNVTIYAYEKEDKVMKTVTFTIQNTPLEEATKYFESKGFTIENLSVDPLLNYNAFDCASKEILADIAEKLDRYTIYQFNGNSFNYFWVENQRGGRFFIKMLI